MCRKSVALPQMWMNLQAKYDLATAEDASAARIQVGLCFVEDFFG